MKLDDVLKFNETLRRWCGDEATLWLDICFALHTNGPMSVNDLAAFIGREDKIASLAASLNANRHGKMKTFNRLVTATPSFEARWHLVWELSDKGREFITELLTP